MARFLESDLFKTSSGDYGCGSGGSAASDGAAAAGGSAASSTSYPCDRSS